MTPHVSCTEEIARPLRIERVAENVRRHGDGRPLLGVVDVVEGY